MRTECGRVLAGCPSPRTRPLWGLCFGLAGLVAAEPSAAAEPSSLPPLFDAEVAVSRSATRHTRDGFYLRVTSGLAAYDERLSASSGSDVSGRNRGIASAGEIALGGSIGTGWILGGSIQGLDVIASGYHSVDEPPPLELDPGLRNLALIGPFVSWFPNTDSGIHFDLGLGLATLTPRVFGHDATERSEYLALGAGLSLAAGYDVWIADEWSLGVLARNTVSVLSGSDDANRDWLHIVTASPALFVALTYH